MTIGNDTVAADEYREILDPATREIVGLAPVATSADLDAAVAAAGDAFAPGPGPTMKHGRPRAMRSPTFWRRTPRSWRSW